MEQLTQDEKSAVLGEENDTVLRVKSSSSAASLASALSHAIYDNKKVILRAIGAGAVNQAVKAIAIANGYVGQRGIILSARPGFTTTTLDNQEISVVTLLILVN